MELRAADCTNSMVPDFVTWDLLWQSSLYPGEHATTMEYEGHAFWISHQGWIVGSTSTVEPLSLVLHLPVNKSFTPANIRAVRRL